MSDIVEDRVCRECGNEFPFTQRDLDFYTKQGWTTRPNRCKPCRVARKNKEDNSQPQNKKVSL